MWHCFLIALAGLLKDIFFKPIYVKEIIKMNDVIHLNQVIHK